MNRFKFNSKKDLEISKWISLNSLVKTALWVTFDDEFTVSRLYRQLQKKLLYLKLWNQDTVLKNKTKRPLLDRFRSTCNSILSNLPSYFSKRIILYSIIQFMCILKHWMYAQTMQVIPCTRHYMFYLYLNCILKWNELK